MIYLNLAAEFFKTGLFAVGGGLATIPFLREISVRYDWFTESELINMVAVSESTPGPVGVNMSTYAGFNAAGVLGGIIATLALILPSLITVLIVARFLNRFGSNKIVEGTFYALRPISTGLIAGAAFSLLFITAVNIQTNEIRPFALIMYAVFTGLCFAGEYLLKKSVHPIIFIAAGAVLGILFGGKI